MGAMQDSLLLNRGQKTCHAMLLQLEEATKHMGNCKSGEMRFLSLLLKALFFPAILYTCVHITTHQVSKVVCLLGWFVTVALSAGNTEALLDTLFSMQVLSGRGDGTEQRNSKQCTLSSAKNPSSHFSAPSLPLTVTGEQRHGCILCMIEKKADFCDPCRVILVVK